MSTQTTERTDSLDGIDFEAQCHSLTGTVQDGMLIRSVRCEQPAKWVANFPCCGVVHLACQDHRASPLEWFCQGCHLSSEQLMNWRRL